MIYLRIHSQLGISRLVPRVTLVLVAILFLLSSSGNVVIMPAPDVDVGVPPDMAENPIEAGRELDTSLSLFRGFTENLGQLDSEEVVFYSRSSSGGIAFTNSAVVLTVIKPGIPSTIRDPSGESVSWRDGTSLLVEPSDPMAVANVWYTFEGSSAIPPTGRDEVAWYHNFFLGNDSTAWRTRVRSYETIVYKDLYDGIDLEYSLRDGTYKYEFILHPGADPDNIRVLVSGHNDMEMIDEVKLLVDTDAGTILDEGLVAYYMDDPKGRVPISFVLHGGDVYGFEVEGWDPGRTLVIDPLIYSTYLGGSDSEAQRSLAVDASGNAYVSGQTQSWDFPITPGALQPRFVAMQFKVFISKLNANGTELLYSTFLGGATDMGDDGGIDLDIDDNGSLYVTGWTRSTDFPVTANAFQSFQGGDGDAFVAKISEDGDELLYATCIGAGGFDCGTGISVDEEGFAYVSGWSDSTKFPVYPLEAIQRSYGGEQDAFVCKVNQNASSLMYSTYLGGSGYECGSDVTIDSNDSAYIVGYTGSVDFPITKDAYQTRLKGNSYDTFLVKVSSDGKSMEYSTYLGGSDHDRAWGVDVDGAGIAYIVGETESLDLPVNSSSFQDVKRGGWDAFLYKMDASGTALLYATYLGSEFHDRANDVKVTSEKMACVVGYAYSLRFPTTKDAEQVNVSGVRHAFLSVFKENGSAISYSTLFGGSSSDRANAVDIGPNGTIYLAGIAESTDLPTTDDAFRRSLTGKTDAFAIRLALDSKRPHADAGPDQTVEQHTSVVFDGSRSWDDFGIARWAWSFVYDGTPVHLQGERTEFTFDTVGVYEVHLNVTDKSGNWATDTLNITVLDSTPPVAVAGPDLFIDQHETVDITGNSSYDNTGCTSWLWTFVYDGSTVAVPNVTLEFTFDTAGSYVVTLNVSDERGNWATDSMIVHVRDITSPSADAGPDIVVDQNEPIVFNGTDSTDNVAIIDWTWSFVDSGNDVILKGQTPAYTFRSPGTYLATLRVEDGEGNWAEDDVRITVRDVVNPIADAGPDMEVDQFQEVSLDGGSSWDNVLITRYAWTFLDAEGEFILEGRVVTHTFIEVGTFDVALNVSDAAGNWATDRTTVTVRDAIPPTAVAGPNRTVTQGETVILDGSGSSDNIGIVNFTWRILLENEDVVLHGSNVSYSFEEIGMKEVTLTVLDGEFNEDVDTLVITVLDLTPPVALAGDDLVVQVGDTVAFDGSNSTDNVFIVNWTWSFAYNDTQVMLYGPLPTFTFHSPGNYTVSLVVSDASGNSATDSLKVTVSSAEPEDPLPGPNEGPSGPTFWGDPFWILLFVLITVAVAVAFWNLRRTQQV